MQDVVGAFPFKKLFREEMREARQRLVEVDGAKADIEKFDVLRVAGKQDDAAD